MTTEYSKEVIEKALDLLQITTQEKRAEMEAAIYRAAA